MEIKNYSGFITIIRTYTGDNGLYLVDDLDSYVKGSPLAEELDFLKGKEVKIKYWISDIKQSFLEVKENFIKNISGVVNVNCTVHYIEYSGFLWTDEKLKIGGHNLLSELRSNEGKYLNLEIEIV